MTKTYVQITMTKTYVQITGYWLDNPAHETVNTVCLHQWDGEPDDDVMFYMEGEPLWSGMALPIHPEPYIVHSILSVINK